MGKSSVLYILNHFGQCDFVLLLTGSFKMLSAFRKKNHLQEILISHSRKYLENYRCFLLLILFGHVENMFY